MHREIEGVAFDLDGTLYPNFKFYRLILPHIAKNSSLMLAFGKARQIIRKNQENSILPNGDFYEYQAGITAENLGLNKDLDNTLLKTMKERIDREIYKKWEPYFKNVKLYKNVIETLCALKKAGFKLALLSDFPAQTKLENLKLDKLPYENSPLWEAVLCSEHFGVLKPHVLAFNELAKAMALPPEKILYVGNSRPYDIAGAARAGMKTAWIKPALFPGRGLKKPKADFSFSSYRKFINYMLK